MRTVKVMFATALLVAPLAGCYVAPLPGPAPVAYYRPPPPPLYRPPPPRVAIWVPGHYGPYGGWIPGHYRG